MPRITKLIHNKINQRVGIYIDYHFCISARNDVWQEMGLKEGDEITPNDLIVKEKSAWRKLNKKNILHISRQAIDSTVQWFNKYFPNLEPRVIDFRFSDREKLLNNVYPIARNDQNISIFLKGTEIEVITLETASTEIQKGLNYWARLDKVEYAQSQTDRDAWVALYYRHPQERFIWIKPRSEEKYKANELIGNTKNYFVPFNDRSPEVHSSQDFCKYVQSKLEDMSKKRKENKLI